MIDAYLVNLPPRGTSHDLTDDKSTLVQVMTWCCQATSHYLSQCWPRFMSPYGVTRSQWVSTLKPKQNGRYISGDIFKCDCFKWKCILIQTSLKLIPEEPIDNIPAWSKKVYVFSVASRQRWILLTWSDETSLVPANSNRALKSRSQCINNRYWPRSRV